jgi:hypothetical protein
MTEERSCALRRPNMWLQARSSGSVSFFEIKIQKILVVIFVTITAALIPSDVLSKSTRNRFSDFRQNIVIEYLNQDFSVLEMKKNADIISSSRVRG